MLSRWKNKEENNKGITKDNNVKSVITKDNKNNSFKNVITRHNKNN